MTILQQLAALGFTNVTDLGTKNGKTLVKIMTSKGWTYERFSTVGEVTAWAKGRHP